MGFLVVGSFLATVARPHAQVGRAIVAVCFVLRRSNSDAQRWDMLFLQSVIFSFCDTRGATNNCGICCFDSLTLVFAGAAGPQAMVGHVVFAVWQFYVCAVRFVECQ